MWDGRNFNIGMRDEIGRRDRDLLRFLGGMGIDEYRRDHNLAQGKSHTVFICQKT